MTLLLSALFFLTACSDSSDMEEAGMGEEYPAVKTQFAITVPVANGKTGRMAADKVQQGPTPTFLGLDKLWLVPFDKNKLQEQRPQNVYRGQLITLPSTGAYTDADAHVNVYNDVLVPLGTQQFLFYAQAKQTLLPLNVGSFSQGALTTTLTHEMVSTNDIKFSLKPCFVGDMREPNSEWYAQAKTLLDGVNGVFAQVKTWKNSKNVALQRLYNNTLATSAGSGFMIQKMMENLDKRIQELNLNNIQELGKIQEEEGVAKLAEVQNAIYGTAPTALFRDNTFTWKNPKLANFPVSFNIPTGSVQLDYDAQKEEFVYMNVTASPLPNAVKIPNICYPSALTYMALTDIATHHDKAAVDWKKVWQPAYDYKGWGYKVQLDTKVLALKEKVQYAVAGLQVDFTCKNNQLPDNSLNTVDVPADGFPVTGILIGGQPNEAGWNLKSNGKDYDMMVYDKMVNVQKGEGWESGISAKYNSPSKPNYSLLLESKPMQNVPVMVEFLNNTGKEIYGVDKGVIPAGSHFYLMAILKAKSPITVQHGSTSETVTNPPIFMQDITTEVHFKISSLKQAYLTIPDLRLTQMEVGMYVDLSWHTSRTITANIGE